MDFKSPKYTDDQLTRMPPDDLARVYQRAAKNLDKGGQEIIDRIHQLGLKLSSGGMRMSDPVYLKMEDIAWSERGRKAAIEATEKGLPALAGVERLIVEELGERYHPHDGGTMNAGYIVGEVMRHVGYEQDREGKMPKDSVAKTAMKWKLRRKN
jgi:hypothetical protein